jgi:hypothetical protein
MPRVVGIGVFSIGMYDTVFGYKQLISQTAI